MSVGINLVLSQFQSYSFVDAVTAGNFRSTHRNVTGYTTAPPAGWSLTHPPARYFYSVNTLGSSRRKCRLTQTPRSPSDLLGVRAWCIQDLSAASIQSRERKSQNKSLANCTSSYIYWVATLYDLKLNYHCTEFHTTSWPATVCLLNEFG